MKILNRKEFLALPGRVVFAKYKPMWCEEMRIKLGNTGRNDFVHQGLSPESVVECNGCDDLMNKMHTAEEDS